MKEFWKNEVKPHWKVAFLLAFAFAIICAPLGDVVLKWFRDEHTEITTYIIHEDGTPVPNITVVSNGQEIGVSNQFGILMIPRKTRTLQGFFCNEALQLRNGPHSVFRPIVSVDMQNAHELFLTIKHFK